MADPYRVLGVAPSASAGEVRAARLALVKMLHPDLRSTDRPEVRAAAERRLADVNAAYDEVLSSWRVPATAPAEQPDAGSGVSGDSGGAAAVPNGSASEAEPLGSPVPTSLVMGALRAEAFEGLVLAVADLGDVTDVDEPFSLDVFVEGPPPGFCHLELFPEAGATAVVIDSDQVNPASVSEELVEALHRLGLPAHLSAN